MDVVPQAPPLAALGRGSQELGKERDVKDAVRQGALSAHDDDLLNTENAGAILDGSVTDKIEGFDTMERRHRERQSGR